MNKEWAALGHIVEVQQFTDEFLSILFKRAEYFKNALLSGDTESVRVLNGRMLHSVFFEESTRTRFSFESAAHHLGMSVVHTESAKMFSSIAKGESVSDMMQVLSSYKPDAIVIRTNNEGMVAEAANASSVPVINAGDGKGQHPTQSLLDLYTIQECLGRKNNLNIVFGGDMANGRTVRSLAYLLSRHPDNSFTFISPPELPLSDDIRSYLNEKKQTYTESNEIGDAFNNADVVYWTRTQLEKGSGSDIKEIILSKEHALKLPDKSIILHPLPRVREIEVGVDELPQAKYFRQAENGLCIRMALLEYVVNK